MHFGNWFARNVYCTYGCGHLVCSTGNILDFPASSYLKFFQNHSLLDLIATQIEWKTVDGGSQYVDKIIERLGKSVFLETPVKAITRKDKKCLLYAGNGLGKMIFDKVIYSL